MAVIPIDRATEGRMRCPTCKATQEWSDTCRRCKCDLTLLRSAAEACRESRRRCLLFLRAGRLAEAVRQARRGYSLCPDERSSRLLAVCHLARGDWARAVAMVDLAGNET